MKSNEKSPAEETLAKAQETLRRSRATIDGTKKMETKLKTAANKTVVGNLTSVASNIGLIADTIRGVKMALSWVNQKAIQPILALPYVGPAISAPSKFIYGSYYKFTHPYEGESLWQSTKNAVANPFRRRANSLMNLFRKEKVPFAPDLRVRGPLSKHRAGVAALMSAWALTGALSVPVAGDSFNYMVAEPMFDLTRISLTVGFNGVTGHGFGLTRDTLYFGVPSKETGDDIYHVTASTHRNSDESNSVSFEVRDRLVHEVWSWANGHGPFRPDFVVGPIRPDSNKCDTISYGSRFRIARWASFRPDMLSVACQSPGNFAPQVP